MKKEKLKNFKAKKQHVFLFLICLACLLRNKKLKNHLGNLTDPKMSVNVQTK